MSGFMQATRAQWKALLAASLGWMLDGMDVMLYSMVVASLAQDLGMNKSQSGFMMSLTLAASAAGGILFGALADRFGRTRALMGSILLYSIFTAACGLATNLVMLGLFRVLLGFGMGGEWAAGAPLVAETWPAEHRAKALGLMQSAWAIGYAMAAGITRLVLPAYGWRAVFFVGVLPALVTLWIRHDVAEPEIWQRQSAKIGRARIGSIFQGRLGQRTLVASLMNALAMFGWWGLFTWIPSFLSDPVSKGGAGLDVVRSTEWIVLQQIGMWLGYAGFGFIADAIGRKVTYIGYLLMAAVLVALYAGARDPHYLLILGPLVAFFGTGFFSGFGAISAELFPTAVRATAQGFTYNIGRGLSALAPYTVGRLADHYGLGISFYVTSVAFLLAAVTALAIPETRGKALD